jgi:5-hydroxyisourate hydrolase-like protein (transthyretin family)
MPRGEEVSGMGNRYMLLVLLVLSVLILSAIIPVFTVQGLPTSEEFTVKPKAGYDLLAVSSQQASMGKPEKVEITFTKTVTITAGSTVTIIETVANPGKSRFSTLQVSISDPSIPWAVYIRERNSTADTWTTTFSLENLVGSERIDTSLRRIQSLYVKLEVKNMHATSSATFTVTPDFSMDTPVVDVEIDGAPVKGLAIPATYGSDGTPSFRTVEAYSEGKVKPLYDAEWKPVGGISYSFTAPTGVEVKVEYARTEIAGVTTDADTFKPALKAGTEYTVRSILSVNVTGAPGAFIDELDNYASLTFKDVETSIDVKVSWPSSPASYKARTVKLVDPIMGAFYLTTVKLDNALINTATVSAEPVYTGQTVDIAESTASSITYSSSSTEAILKWTTSFNPTVTRYSYYDPGKTSITAVVKDDVVVFEATPYINSTWVRLYDKDGNLKLEARGLKIGYSVPAGEYTERIVYDHAGVAHYARESTVTVRDYPILEKIYTSPYTASGKVTINGQTVDLNTRISLALKPGKHKAELTAGVFAWYVRSHSALASVFEASLPFRKAEWTSGTLKLAEVYSNGEGLTLTVDTDMPRKVFHLSIPTGLTDLTKAFVSGREPLRVIVNGYEGKWSVATFNNTKGYVLDLPLNQTTYTIDIKYPAVVKLTIIDKDEKPIEGAKVKLEHYTGGVRDALYQATTDKDGAVTFASVEPFATDYSLTVTVSDYTTTGKLLINDDVSKTVKLEIEAPPPPTPTVDYTTIFIVIVAVLAIVLSAYFIIKSRPVKAGEYAVRLEF